MFVAFGSTRRLAQPVAIQFGAENGADPSANQPQARFEDLAKLPEPKPRRTFSLRHTLLTAAGVMGFWYGEGAIKRLHTAAETRATQSAPADTLGERLLTGLAKADHTVYQTPVVGHAVALYTKLLTWEGLALALVAGRGIYRKRIRPQDLYAELNRRGLTGKNMTIGVVDSGVLPTGAIQSQRLTQYAPDRLDQPSEPSDFLGHGTAVAHILAEANPDARIVSIPFSTPSASTAIQSEIQALFDKAKKNPGTLTMQAIRQAYQPLMHYIADGVKKAADEGAQVINVSLSLEQAAQMAALFRLIGLTPALLGLMLLTRLTPKSSALHRRLDKIMAEKSQYAEQLQKLVRSNETETLGADLKALYQPWLDALDYAHAKGAAVIVAAGNSGGYSAEIGSIRGNLNPFALVDHPALMMVGSTNGEGLISSFSSESNEQSPPLVAANGSGELTTRIARSPQRSWWKRVLFPIGSNWSLLHPYQGFLYKLAMQNPPGTSFAAPDLSALYLKMKQLDPSLTVAEAREIFSEVAAEAQFGGLQQWAITQEAARTVKNARFMPVVEAIEKVKQGQAEVSVSSVLGPVRVFKESENLITLVFTRSNKISHFSISLSVLGDRSVLPTVAHLFERLEKEDAPVSDSIPKDPVSPEAVQAEIAREKRRRVGAGTLAGRRHQAIYLTEQRLLAKQAASSKAAPTS